MPAISDNLLFLANLYHFRAANVLYKLAEEIAPQQLPNDIDSFMPNDVFTAIYKYLRDLYNASRQDVIDWIIANQTILRQYNADWSYFDVDFLDGWKMNEQYKMTAKSLKTDPNKSYTPVAFLRGNGNIPPMKIYNQENEKPFNPAIYPKEMAHYNFLVQPLRKLLQNKYDLVDADQQLISFFRQFVSENIGLLNQIRSQFQTEPRQLGVGSDGIAFSIGPHRVFKIFKTKYAYDSAIQAVNRLFKSPETAETEAMIYDYGQFKPIYGDTLYYYIIEKMVPLGNVMDRRLEDRLISGITNFAENGKQSAQWKKMLQNPDQVLQVKKEIEQKAKEIMYQLINYDPQLLNDLNAAIPSIGNKMEQYFPKDQQGINLTNKSFQLNPNWITKLIEEVLWKYATGRNDLHGGNIGITSFGDLRYFDPAFYEPKEYKGETTA